MSFPKNARSGASLALVALACACLCAARHAAAESGADRTYLEPDLVVEQQWNSNIFSAESNKEHSPVTIVRPSLAFLNEGELGYLRVNGWLSSHTYWDESDLDGADRGGGLSFNRKLSPRFDVFGDGSLVRYTDQDEIRSDAAVTGQEGVLLSAGAPDIDIDQAKGGLRYLLGPRTKTELSGGPYAISYNHHPLGATTYRDRTGWYANWNLTHELTQIDRLTMDLGVSLTDQDSVTAALFNQNEGVGVPPSRIALDTGESRSEQQNVTLGWERSWSPRWSTGVSLGVRRLDSHVTAASRPASTPASTLIVDGGNVVFGFAPTETFIPVDFDDTSPAMIGTVFLRRTFEHSLLTLSYSRETEVASGALSSDVDVDSFEVQYAHRLAERVTLNLNGSFDYYTSANDSPQLVPAYFTPQPASEWDPAVGAQYTCGGLFGPGGKLIVTGNAPNNYGQCEVGTSNELTGQKLTLGARIDWQMRKRLGSFLYVRYFDQRGDPGLWGSDYNKYTAGIGFRYAWDLEL